MIFQIRELNDHIGVVVNKTKEVSELIVSINMKGVNGHSVHTTKILTYFLEEEVVIEVTKSLSTAITSTCQDPAIEEISHDQVTTMTIKMSNLADEIEGGMREQSLLVILNCLFVVMKRKKENS